MPITALPTPPLRTDPTNFATRGDAFLAALPTFVTQANALEANVDAKEATVNANALSAAASANLATTNGAAQVTLASAQANLATTNGAAQVTLASAQASLATTNGAAQVTLATTQANLAAASASSVAAPLWVSGTTYAIFDVRRSPAEGLPYRRLTAGAGTSDPSLDATNWGALVQPIAAGGTGATSAGAARANLGLTAVGGAALVGNTPAGNITAGTVQAALNELDTKKTQATTLAAAGGAELVGNTPAGNIAATKVQAAINELDAKKASVVNPSFTAQTLVDTASIAWNMNLGGIAKVTLSANRAVALPTNRPVGTCIFEVIQDATGGRLLTWDAAFKWSGGAAPVLSTAANAKDVLSFYSDGTNLIGGLFARGYA